MIEQDHDELEKAIQTQNLERVRGICKRNPDLVRDGWRGGKKSWVHFAITRNLLDVVATLVKCGADINKGKNNYPNENALDGCIASSRL